MPSSQRVELASTITAAWQDLLGVDGGLTDDGFFELGGDSIVAARLVGRLRKETGADVPLAVVFDNVTLSQLIVHVEDSVAGQSEV